MPNLDLKNKTFEIPKNLRSLLNNNENISYSNMNKKMSELNNKDVRTPEDDKVLTWLKGALKKAINTNEAPKKIKKETGATGGKAGGNNYKDTHTKEHEKEMSKMRYLIEYMNNNKTKLD